ncbi:hypothetical protein SLEP1_g2625 [Rubroshorea leprosula]|uniref:Growth-regulating factor n=1 Tax=Rubroshorea leprosula TaxID=152421 RepID=A0AAV5HM55_9ROSI|nr:hypothetical protein SLEP1_g2625 [Rubroshorea leprosula]
MSLMEDGPLPISLSSSDSEGEDGGSKGRSTEKGWEGKMVGEKSPSINLGLGIGANPGQNHVIKHKKHVFTPAQLHELQHQALIYRFMAAGIPVPPQLVFPIWKSVSGPFVDGDGRMYRQFSNFVAFSSQGVDDGNMIEPEPGRCRRTDGKKWRCSRSVVTDQKYCERHMHRGRQRSRKPVEPSQIEKPEATSPSDSKKDPENKKTPVSNPVNLQLMIPTPGIPSTSYGAASTTATGGKSIVGHVNSISTMATTRVITNTNVTTTNTANLNENKKRPNNNARGEEKVCFRDSNIVKRSSKTGNNISTGQWICLGSGISPTSVLQVRGSTSSLTYRNEVELEPGRCRRTDGKKWRCSREVVPDQKYCLRHMHRGVKKAMEAPSSSANDSPPSRLTTPKKEDCLAPSTNLSIAISTPQLPKNAEKSMSSTSSDATISDTTITA